MKPSRLKSNLGWQLVAAIYALSFLMILLLSYQGKLPPILTRNDKFAHLVLYGIATYLGHRAWVGRRLTILKLRLPLFPILFGIFTVVEEMLQSYSPNRTLDGGDLVASFIGIAIGYWLADQSKPK